MFPVKIFPNKPILYECGIFQHAMIAWGDS